MTRTLLTRHPAFTIRLALLCPIHFPLPQGRDQLAVPLRSLLRHVPHPVHDRYFQRYCFGCYRRLCLFFFFRHCLGVFHREFCSSSLLFLLLKRVTNKWIIKRRPRAAPLLLELDLLHPTPSPRPTLRPRRRPLGLPPLPPSTRLRPLLWLSLLSALPATLFFKGFSSTFFLIKTHG